MTDESHELTRVHERLDEVLEQLVALNGSVQGIEERCRPCSEMVSAHQETLHGNGRDGLLVRLATTEKGRVDTLSIKSVCTLVTAIGAMAAAIGAAIVAGFSS